MSLVNDMLRDLERRERPAEASALDGLRPAGGARAGALRPVVVAVLAGLVVASVLVLWRLDWLRQPPAPAVTQVQPVSQPVSQPNRLGGIEARVNPDRLELRLQTDRMARHRLVAEQGRVRLSLADVKLAAVLPDLAGRVSRLQSADLRQGAEQLDLELQFDGPVRVQSSWSGLEQQPLLRVTVHLPPPQEAADTAPAAQPVGAAEPEPAAQATPVARAPAPASRSEPTPRPADQPAPATPSPEQRTARAAPPPGPVKREAAPDPVRQAARHEAEGLRMMEAGRREAALTAFRRALELDPRREGAQRGLLGALLALGRTAEAEDWLRARAEPAPWQAEALARLLMERGDDAAALAVLEASAAAADADYLALLAALYQRLGRYDQAVQSYLRLVRLDPARGVWWMGLGLALEGRGDAAQARDAYRRAVAAGGLTADVEAYVQGRLQALRER